MGISLLFQYLILSVDKFLQLLEILILVDAVMSWIIKPGNNVLSKLLRLILDPILKPCYLLQRKVLPNSPVDFSPLLAMLFIEFIRNILFSVFSR